MGIGYRIKEARERLGLTQTDLGAIVGITGSAITNYEKETSHPKEHIIYKLIEALNVDANYLFQDCVNLPKITNNITLMEFDHIKKYLALDQHGKTIVDMVLEEERARQITEQAKADTIKEQVPEHLILNAAHDAGATPAQKIAADNIMADDDEWR